MTSNSPSESTASRLQRIGRHLEENMDEPSQSNQEDEWEDVVENQVEQSCTDLEPDADGEEAKNALGAAAAQGEPSNFSVMIIFSQACFGSYFGQF